MNVMDPFDQDDGMDQPVDDPEGAGRGISRTIAIGIAVVLTMLVVSALALGSDSSDSEIPEDLSVLDPPVTPEGLALTDAVDELPDHTLTRFGGEGQIPVRDYLGGPPLVLNFWATWCAPCVAEMPDFQTVHEAAGDDFRLVGINTKDAPSNAEAFVDELGISYDLAVDRQGDYFNATGSFGMPTTLFVTPDGGVAYRHTGPLTIQQMVDLLAEHLDVTVDLSQA